MAQKTQELVELKNQNSLLMEQLEQAEARTENAM